MPPPHVPGFVTAGDALRKALASNGDLTARLIAYRDALGSAESKALIADALDELSRGRWLASLLLEELRWIEAFAQVRSRDESAVFAKVSREAMRTIAQRAGAAIEQTGRAA